MSDNNDGKKRYEAWGYSIAGTISLFIGVVILLFGMVSAYIISSQFSGAQFLGNYLANPTFEDQGYTVLILLSVIIIVLGFILIVIGALSIIKARERRFGYVD